MFYYNRVAVICQHLIELLIALGSLVGASPEQVNAALLHVHAHLELVDDTRSDLLAVATPALELTGSLRARQHATGTVDRGVEVLLGLHRIQTANDHALVHHGRADEGALTRKRGSRALANHEVVLAGVLLDPREVVVVVDLISELRRPVDDLSHRGADPLATRIGVLTRQVHGLEVCLTQVRVHVHQNRIRVHAGSRTQIL